MFEACVRARRKKTTSLHINAAKGYKDRRRNNARHDERIEIDNFLAPTTLYENHGTLCLSPILRLKRKRISENMS